MDFLKENLVVEIKLFELQNKNQFSLQKTGHLIVKNKKVANCEPEGWDNFQQVFWGFTQCCLQQGMKPWDWQLGSIYSYKAQRAAVGAKQVLGKDEL